MLLAYNLTGAPVVLSVAVPPRTLPASSGPPARGPAVNVTSELRPNATVDPVHGVTGGLTGANYVALQAIVTGGSIYLEWIGDPEYLTTGLIIPGALPGPHKSTHTTVGSDALTIASTTPGVTGASATGLTTTSTTPGVTGASATGLTTTSTTPGATGATATGLTVTAGGTRRALSWAKGLPAAGVAIHAQDVGGAALNLVAGFTNPLPRRTLNVARSAAGPANVTYHCAGASPDAGTVFEDLVVASGGNATTAIAAEWNLISTTVDPVSTSDFTTGDGFCVGSLFTGTPVLSVNGVVEALVSSDTATGTIVPTTSPDGSAEFTVGLSEPHGHAVSDPTHTHGSAAHDHGVADPTHTHGSTAHDHGVADPTHTHGSTAHGHNIT